MAIAVGCAPFRSEGFACVDGFIPGVGLASGAPLSPPSAHEEMAAQQGSPSAGVGGASDFPSLRASGLGQPCFSVPRGHRGLLLFSDSFLYRKLCNDKLERV